MQITRTRGWSWYALIWVPIALLHSLNIAATSPIPFSQALVAGVTYVIPVALLGAASVYLSLTVEPADSIVRLGACLLAIVATDAKRLIYEQGIGGFPKTYRGE